MKMREYIFSDLYLAGISSILLLRRGGLTPTAILLKGLEWAIYNIGVTLEQNNHAIERNEVVAVVYGAQ